MPYNDLNTAAKINVGLDIISVLNDHYKTNAPVFIDNAESVIKLFKVNSQLVRLVVSGQDKSLRIESN